MGFSDGDRELVSLRKRRDALQRRVETAQLELAAVEKAVARAEDFIRLLNRTEPPPGW